MSTTAPPRYVVCDENRRAPNNTSRPGDALSATVLFGPDGDCARFDRLDDAVRFAKSVWYAARGEHLVAVRDKMTPNFDMVWSEPPKAT